MSSKTLSARSSAGTGHLIRHQASCRQKTDDAHRVQSRLAPNRDGFHNWVYNPVVARTELLLALLSLTNYFASVQRPIVAFTREYTWDIESKEW